MPILLRWFLTLGPTNPIAVRLVQGGSRRARHFYIRAAYLGVLIAVLLYALLFNATSGTPSIRDLARAGAVSFAWIAYLQIGLICVLAPVFMAGAIVQEANPQTWDILLTTPLAATQIVLGNLFGRLFFILALLFSSLPLFAVTQYFGGVPGASIFLSYLIAACAALFVAAAAIALSVSRLVGKRAVFAFYVTIISYLAVTLGVDRVVSAGGVTYMTAVNPFLALHSLLNPTGYKALAVTPATGALDAFMLGRPVFAFCMISAGLSLLLMAASVITVRAGGLAAVGKGIAAASAEGSPWYRRLLGRSAQGERHRAPRTVWHNPIAWREAAARNATPGRIAARWSFIALGGLYGIAMVLWFHAEGKGLYGTAGATGVKLFRQVVQYTAIGELGVISLVAVQMAATAVAREREDGTLDLLLTTPITPSQYLTGKLRGMIAYLLPMIAVPLGTLLLAGLYVGLVSIGLVSRAGGVTVPFTPNGPGSTVAMPAVLPEGGLVVAAVTVPFIAFCVMVGLQWSLKSKGSLGAVTATVGVAGAVAGVVGLCAWTAGSSIPIVGPAAAALSPGTAVFASVWPEDAMDKAVTASLGAARVALLIGSVVGGCIYAAVVYGIHANMVRTFDMTVRRLAGNK